MKEIEAKRICSITVSYNPDIDVLKRQVSELIKQVDKVVIVDNNSNNFDALNLEFSRLDDVVIISLKDNMGIAYAQNRGLEVARSSNSSHVIFFDHDSEIPEGFIFKLLLAETDLISSGENVAAVGPCFVHALTKEKYPVPYIVDIPLLKGLFIGRKHFSNQNFIESYFLIASGCLMRMSVIDDVGNMDSDLFIDNVDLEWCLRAQTKGYKVFTSNRTYMSHLIGDKIRYVLGRKISVHSNIRKYYNTRNNLFLIKQKDILIGLKLRVVPALFIRFIIGLPDSDDRVEYLKYYFFAVYDFIYNKKGKFNH